MVCGEGRVFAPKPIKNHNPKREVVNFSNPKREVVKQCHPNVVSNSPNKKTSPFPYAMRAGKVHRAPWRAKTRWVGDGGMIPRFPVYCR